MNTITEWSARVILLVALLTSAGTAWAEGGAGACKPGRVCVPEPASIALLSVGVGAIVLYRRFRGPRN